MLHGVRAVPFAVTIAVSLVMATGCAQPLHQLPDRAERMPRGYLYYLDGAGGGVADRNWAAGVRDGLLAAGYKAAGEMFSWELGLGMIADQNANVEYKRSKAAALAKRIEQYKEQYPTAPVSIIGFSAGAAAAVFTLEALPEGCQVENVVLLGASIGTDYDLTQALRHVRNRVFLYTSTKDMMLGFLVPLAGTADRRKVPAAGVNGFALPANASDETRRLYAEKVVTIAWTKELESDGHYGKHFDNVNMTFIRDHVAPLIMDGGPRASGRPSLPE